MELPLGVDLFRLDACSGASQGPWRQDSLAAQASWLLQEKMSKPNQNTYAARRESVAAGAPQRRVAGFLAAGLAHRASNLVLVFNFQHKPQVHLGVDMFRREPRSGAAQGPWLLDSH